MFRRRKPKQDHYDDDFGFEDYYAYYYDDRNTPAIPQQDYSMELAEAEDRNKALALEKSKLQEALAISERRNEKYNQLLKYNTNLKENLELAEQKELQYGENLKRLEAHLSNLQNDKEESERIIQTHKKREEELLAQLSEGQTIEVKLQAKDDEIAAQEREMHALQEVIEELEEKLVANNEENEEQLQASEDEKIYLVERLTTANNQIEKMKTQTGHYSKEEIAEVMLEAQNQAKQIMMSAKYEERRILERARQEQTHNETDLLRVQEQLKKLQEEVNQFFRIYR